MTIEAFDHYTIRANDLEATWRFYAEVLGFRVEQRANFPGKAAVVWIGDSQVVHVFQASDEMQAVFARLAAPDEATRQWRTGRLQHVGFWATDHWAMKSRFDRHGVPYRESTLPDKHQLVVHDPDEIEIEINFPLAELTA
jgi:catechol 2,3-dioxygenase-like lactoylglutathione lyase family enzyme